MEEIFKDIPGYEGMYQVSNLGNVKSLKRSSEKILKNAKNARGYLEVCLCKNSVGTIIRIHQLVAMAFLGHKRDGMKLVIDHIDNNKLNNRLENLQIITQRENVFKDQGKYTSKYKGVHFYHYNNKWLANIRVKQRLIHLGLFKTELEASEAYQNALKLVNSGYIFIVKEREKSNKYVGVNWNKLSKKWIARISVNKIRVNLGSFNTELEALKAYQNKLAEIQ